MKKIIALISVLICLSMLLASCGGTPTPDTSSAPTPSVTSSKTDTGSSVIDSSIVDSSTIDSSTIDSSTIDSSTVDSSTVDSSTIDSSTTDSSTTDSSTQDSQKPDPEPEIPDQAITLATNGVSDYVVIYDDGDDSATNFATKIVQYISKTHKISLEMVGESVSERREHCIFIGDVAGAQRAKEKFNTTNDFGAVVSGDDYVLYATSSQLYSYLYDLVTSEVLTSIRGGNWSTRPAKNFVYHKSTHAQTPYLQYLINKNGGKFSKDVMMQMFEARTFKGAEVDLPYRIYVPDGYDGSKSYPVLIFLHGANDRGTNNTSQMANMIFHLFNNESNPIWDSIVICPQCPSAPDQWVDTPWKQGDYRIDEVPESAELKTVMQILDKVEKDYVTDTSRYYVTGLSMGGFGTWDLIMRHTDRFAGAVPICGGADQTQAENLLNMPIYTVHDSSDYDVPTSGTRLTVNAIKALGGEKIIYEELVGYSHNVWDYTAQKLEIWQWLFAQSKSAE